VTGKEYVAKITEITKGVCHAVVNFTASKAAYDSAPDVLRTGGILIVVGIPNKPLTFNAMDMSLGQFRARGASNAVPQQLKPCIEFSAKHNIKPHVSYFKIDQIQEMIDKMRVGKARGRVAV
jgi:propanol-preferring alcohol dehydrogenase